MIKRLLSFMGEYKRYAVLSPLCVMAETVCELILPLLMAAMINDGIQGGDLSVLWTTGAAMLVLSILSLATGTLSAKYATYAAQGLGANLRKAEFDQINEFSFADIDRFSSASLITRLTNDLTNIQNIVIMGLRILVRCVTMMVVSILMALYLNWRLAIIVLVTLPILAAFVFGLQRICHPLFQSMQKKIDDLNENVQENLVAIRVVKAFVRQDFERKKFKTANDNFTEAGLKAVLRIVLMQPIMMMGITIATALVMWNGGNMVMDGTLLVGDLSAFNNYIFQILFSVQMLAMALLQYSRAHACASRIFEVLDTVPDIRNGAETARQLPARQGLVEFRDVSFKYRAAGTGDDVLSHINFTARPGQTLAIVGGTGVGKSTLVNLIPRFYDATGGDVLVDGLSVKEYPLEELRGRIGMVLQNNVLFSGTIRENLLWGREDATEAEMMQAAKDAQAYDFIMSFPNGFDTRLDQGGVNVSGGQKQRLCIARAMLRQPSILILDDSTSAVDSATEAAIRESFHANLKDTTVILIAQRISSVRSADQILVLDDGTVAAMGTHDELMRNSPIYQEIYWSQQEGVSE